MKKQKTIFLYWGRRGGGFRMTHEFLHEYLADSKQQLEISVRPELFSNFFSQQSVIKNIEIAFGASLLETILSVSFCKSVKDFITAYGNETPRRKLIIFMASPLDTFFGRILSKKFEVWRVIHDGEKHQGDLWPSTRQIHKWVKRDNVIVLSRYVHGHVARLTNKRIILSSLIRKENPPAGSNSFGKPYYLITGRGKRYQRNFSIYDLAEMLPIALVVSGEIEFAVNHPNVHAMGKWLIDSEMETLIKNASAVFCIYSEGSQSGIIEQSLSHGVPVVATNVGGLREQIREGVDGFLIDDISEILDAHIKLQKLDRARVGKARSELSLYETLKEESFFLA